MALWSRLVALAGAAFSGPEATGEIDPCAPDRGDADFAAAVVALAAKMAKADGRSTLDEAAAFRAAFPVDDAERAMFDRFFALAQETVHGYEAYARRIGRRYRARPCLLEDVLDILFVVARADGDVTPEEEAYLSRVGELFGFSQSAFARIAAPYFPGRAPDPYTILDVDHDASDADVRRAWTRQVAENHPDTFIARGAPPEFVQTAHEKTAAVNAAYAAIRKERDAQRQTALTS
jgi:DnaJ like chaperone protein